MRLQRIRNWVLAITAAAFLGFLYAAFHFMVLSRWATNERESLRVYFAVALALGGIAFAGIVDLLLDRSVVCRLAALNASIENIAGGVDETNRGIRSGRDELAALGQTVGRMIETLRLSQKQRDEIEARHRIFMNHLPAIAAIKDESGRYLYCNDLMAKIFNLDREHLETAQEIQQLPAEVAELIRSHDLEVLRLAKAVEFEEMVPAPDGAERYWLTLRFPLTAFDGSVLIGMAAIDITERKHVEAELRAAREQAELACRTKAEFLADISHEVRAPINAAIGMTDLTLETGLTSEQRGYLATVKSSARLLLSLFNDILDFEKMDAGALDFEKIEFNLPAAIESLAQSFSVGGPEDRIDLSFRFFPGVPDAVCGDPTRLRQVISNLIHGALKSRLSGEVVLSVESEMQTEDEVVLHFSIGTPADLVPGATASMGDASAENVLHPVDEGLGFTIASRLVEMMGGTMWTEGGSSKGCAFHFNARFDLPNPFSETGRPVPVSKLRGVRVLVADDNATNRRILADMLTAWQMRVSLTSGGAEAYAELDRGLDQGAPYAIAVLDGRMPDMDGFSLANKIKKEKNFANLSVVLLTSAGIRGDAARCRDLGIKAYLPKPVGPADLLDALRRILGQMPADRRDSSLLVTRHSLREARRQLKILLAEDNAVDRTLAVRLLEKRGYQVEAVETGKAVLDALEQQTFDVILMDVQMPEMDGLEATAAIRNHERLTGRHIPIVAMTAYAMSGDKERCLAAGMDRYISKPLKIQHLYQIVDEVSAPVATV